MFDYDAIIIGSGPAGLTAAIYLARARYRTLVLEKEQFGGKIMNVEWIENYPGFSEGISGPNLASEMIEQAMKAGAELEIVEVSGVEVGPNLLSVNCANGISYKAAVVIMAAGSMPRKLGVPGEAKFAGKGLIHCALCDGGQFTNQVVAVCGGGDAGITEALYMAKLASKVVLIEAMPHCTGTAVLQERMAENPKVELRCGYTVVEIKGDEKVQGLEIINAETGLRETLAVNGVLVYVGNEPNNTCLKRVVPLDERGQFVVDAGLRTKVSAIIAAGDIRSNSPCQVSSAVGDGATAAISAQKLLQERAGRLESPRSLERQYRPSRIPMSKSDSNSEGSEEMQNKKDVTPRAQSGQAEMLDKSGVGTRAVQPSGEWELVVPETDVFVEAVSAKVRSSSLKGKTVLLRRNDKPNSDIFLERIGMLLEEKIDDICVFKGWEVIPGSDAAKPGLDRLKEISALKPDLVISAQGD
jgi:thioredoxin reductase (NADPH)